VERGRYALIVAGYEYQDPGLRRLRAPARDAEALAGVLRDAQIGGFDVRAMVNEPAHVVNEAVEDFFAERSPQDLLVLHFSCHGVKDESGELYFAMANTKLRRLGATAVSADFVNRRMNRSRSRRIVLLLDCCYAGAFERGIAAKAGAAVHVEEQFGGRGRAVITASGAMEYAFEDVTLTDARELEASIFTRALVDGLETGDADRDQDGLIGLDELYDYVYDRVREVTPNQTPGKWTFAIEGELHIARRRSPVTTPAPLPTALQDMIDGPMVGERLGAVHELTRLLSGRHAGIALGARQALERLQADDSRMVAGAAATALAAQPAARQPVETPAPPPLEAAPAPSAAAQAPPQPPVEEAQAPPMPVQAASPPLVEKAQAPPMPVQAPEPVVDPRPTTVPQPPAESPGQPAAAGPATTTHPWGEPPAQPRPARRAARDRTRPRQDEPKRRDGDRVGYFQGDRLATWRQRVGAGLIDLLPLVPGYAIIGAGGGAAVVIGVLVLVAALVYNRWHLQGTTGQSWGKGALHLTLVRMADKQPVGRRRAFVRDLAHAFDILTLGLGYLLPLWDARRRTLADRIMKTVVISRDKTEPTRERVP